MTATLEAPPRRFTAEDALDWVGDETPWELVEGRRIDLMPGGWQHSRVIRALERSLSRFVEDHGLGELLTAETGVLLAKNPDTIRAADLAFIPALESPSRAPSGWVTTIPRLVIEVVSPTDRPRSVAEKAQSWLAAGVMVVWVVDPGQRRVTVYEGDKISRIEEGGVLEGGTMLPDYRISLDELFGR